MKNRVIILCLVFCFIICVIIVLLYNKYYINQKELVYPEYVVKSEAEVKSICKDYGFELNSEFTWWEQYYDKDQLNKAISEYNLLINEDIISNMDFKNKTCVVSFGREIIDIQYQKNQKKSDVSYVAEVTFDDSYQGNKAFVYLIDRITFFPSGLVFNDVNVYKMVNGNRVLWGTLSEVNKRQNGPGGI